MGRKSTPKDDDRPVKYQLRAVFSDTSFLEKPIVESEHGKKVMPVLTAVDDPKYGPRGSGEGEGRLYGWTYPVAFTFMLMMLFLTAFAVLWLVIEYETVIRWQAEAWAAWNSYAISVWPGDWVEQNPLVVLWGIGGVKEGVASTLAGWVVSGILTAIARRRK